MKRRHTALTLSLIALSTSAMAAESVLVQQTTWQQLKKEFFVDLGIKSHQMLKQEDNGNTLKLLRAHTDKNKVTHYRLEQQYEGIPVMGGYLILHTKDVGSTLLYSDASIKMNGKVYEKLKNDLDKKPADLEANGEKALAHFVKSFKAQDMGEKTVKPVIYVDKQNRAHWAYQVTVFVHSAKMPSKPAAIIDAKTFKPFVTWNDLKTSRQSASGMGHGGNQKVGELTYGKDYPLLEITRSSFSRTCYLENEDVRVVNMENHSFGSSKPMKFSCKKGKNGIYWTGKKGDGYDKVNGAFSPSNDALYAGYVIKHLYKDWYDVEVLHNSDDSPMKLIMRVHYGEDYENAYWDGKQMTFGDGDQTMYPLVSLGVGAHEVSHGFTEQHSDLTYYAQSGGLNESFSDMAAMAAEYYANGKADWMIGADIMKPESGADALRYMDQPSKDGMSIDSAKDYTDDLDVHFSSGVYNRLYYLMSTQTGWDPRKAFDVMVKANMDYWTPDATFDTAACGVLSAAADLGMDTKAIKASMDLVAVNYTDCDEHKKS